MGIRIVEANEDAGDIFQRCRRIESLFRQLQVSIPDYMLQRDRSKQFHCDATQHHELLTNGSFNLKKAQLQFIIC